jgi:hypothetical protein
LNPIKHAAVDVLCNPTSFHFMLGQAHDLCGADELIPHLEGDILLADKAYDAAERMIDVLQNAGKQSVIF